MPVLRLEMGVEADSQTSAKTSDDFRRSEDHGVCCAFWGSFLDETLLFCFIISAKKHKLRQVLSRTDLGKHGDTELDV